MGVGAWPLLAKRPFQGILHQPGMEAGLVLTCHFAADPQGVCRAVPQGLSALLSEEGQLEELTVQQGSQSVANPSFLSIPDVSSKSPHSRRASEFIRCDHSVINWHLLFRIVLWCVLYGEMAELLFNELVTEKLLK